MKNNLKSRDRDLVVQELENETLIYDLTTNKAYCLNETAAFVWKSLDGETDVKRIADNLAGKAKCAVNEEIVWLAIEQLKKDNLIANADELPNRFEGMNRREVVKRIGLATMIALPVVSTIVAPMSANAASLRANCADCTTNADCASGACRPAPFSTPNPACASSTTATSAYRDGQFTAGSCSPDCASFGTTRCCSGSARALTNSNCPTNQVQCQCA